MKKKVLPGLGICAACLLSLGHALPGDGRAQGGLTTAGVTIDGTSYLSRPRSASESELLRRELERMGVALPDGDPVPRGPEDGHPLFHESLVSGPGRPTPTILPQGLSGGHSIRMEGSGQFTELIFGRLSSAAPIVRERLLAEGWVSAVDGQEPHAPRVFRKALGKENSVACLDERDRTFLLVRTVVR